MGTSTRARAALALLTALFVGSASVGTAQYTTENPLPAELHSHAMVATQGNVFVLGGYEHFNPNFATDAVYRAPVLAGGALGAWITAGPMPRNLWQHAAVTVGDRIYVLGGEHFDGYNLAVSDEIYVTTVAPDGTPGPWTVAGYLPLPLVSHTAAVLNGRVYVTGGASGFGNQSGVHYADLSPSGLVGSWTQASSLPTTLYWHTSAALDRLYVLGGEGGPSFAPSDQVLTATAAGDGSLSNWTTEALLPYALDLHASVVHGSKIFVLGGVIDAAARTEKVWSSAVDGAGGLAPWQPEDDLPCTLQQHAATVFGDHLYVSAGWCDGLASAAVYSLQLPPVTWTAYCSAGTSASGCAATLSACGSASASSPSGFELTAAGIEGEKDGLFYYGANGRQANPWGNGTSLQCVVPPVRRGGLLTGSGSAGLCDGLTTQDLNARWCPSCPKPQHNLGAGATAQVQFWYRDPLNTSNQTTSFSNALEFAVAP